jgi:hypothetical protein
MCLCASPCLFVRTCVSVFSYVYMCACVHVCVTSALARVHTSAPCFIPVHARNELFYVYINGLVCLRRLLCMHANTHTTKRLYAYADCFVCTQTHTQPNACMLTQTAFKSEQRLNDVLQDRIQVCMYVCVHMYACICVCQSRGLTMCFRPASRYICMYTYLCMHMCACVCYVYVCIYIYMYVCIYIYMHLYSSCIHTYTYRICIQRCIK